MRDKLMPVIKRLNLTTLSGIWAKLNYMNEVSRLYNALSEVNIEKAYLQVVNIIKEDKNRKINKEINP